MALTTIYPNGTSTVNIPATESIAISNYGGGIASIYYLVKNANRPDAYQLQQTIENAGVVLGAFADGKTVKIEAGGSTVVFDVGASPDTGIGDADTLNGMASDTGDTADTIAARDSNGDITANAFESTVATGTAPLTVASTTVVPNLNASQLGGNPSTYYATDSLVVHLAGAETVTGAKTFSDDLTLSKASTPAFEFNESGTATLGRIKHNSNNLYIQDANVLFTNRYDGNITSVKIRQNSTDYSVYHEGNDTPLMHLAGAETITGVKSFASGAIEIAASSGAKLYSGAGSPESAITASPGSLYLNTSGGANTTLYVKESGTGNTGWIAK